MRCSGSNRESTQLVPSPLFLFCVTCESIAFTSSLTLELESSPLDSECVERFLDEATDGSFEPEAPGNSNRSVCLDMSLVKCDLVHHLDICFNRLIVNQRYGNGTFHQFVNGSFCERTEPLVQFVNQRVQKRSTVAALPSYTTQLQV